MYYITGDCHCDFSKIEWFCRFHKTSEDDVMILLGDVGLNLTLDEVDVRRKEKVAQLPLTLFCVHGNHEARPETILAYEEREWKGGTVFAEQEYPNILFAKDGEIYDFDGERVLVIGGAYSVDKYYRLQVGLPWFADEQPSKETRECIEKKLEQNQWKVDYVLTHTCPRFMIPPEQMLRFVEQEAVDFSTEDWMERICKRLSFKKWYFGHFHDNRRYLDFELLYEEIKELGMEDFLQRLGRPKYKLGEQVGFIFSDGEQEVECYGKIEYADRYGTMGQVKEVSYDIYGWDYLNQDAWVLYKHIAESNVWSLEKE